MGIKADAWWKVAETEKGAINTWKLPMNFKIGRATKFETFCRRWVLGKKQTGVVLLRHWYSAVDDAGVSMETRIKWLLEMRQKYLGHINVGHPPSPKSVCMYANSLICFSYRRLITVHIFVISCDYPIPQCEGFLTNIRGRIQLYCIVENGICNQRAISSLDSQTFFFFGFQVCISKYINEIYQSMRILTRPDLLGFLKNDGMEIAKNSFKKCSPCM
jgi:hypothetical protein